jgi:HemY protein
LQEDEVDALWSGIPRQLRQRQELLHARIDASLSAGAHNKAEKLIRKALDKEWDAALIHRYGELRSDNVGALLRRAEGWLSERQEDADLLLVCGRLCVRNELWGKARSYLESSIAIRQTPAAYHQLGLLMQKLDEKDAATDAFAKGLTLSNSGALNVPQITNKA